MSIKPTQSGGRVAFEDTPFGKYRVEWDGDGQLISHELEIRDPRPSKGLGDTVAKVTDATGLSKIAKWYEKVTGKPCGCDKRRQKMNRKYPYKEAKDG